MERLAMEARSDFKASRFDQIPQTWVALTEMLPLRPIRDDVDWGNAMDAIDRMAGHALNRDQEDYLESLSALVFVYEQAHHAVSTAHLHGLRALRSLLDDHRMNASGLARLLNVHRGHASKILNGERSLTARHMRLLAEHFKVNPSLFM